MFGEAPWKRVRTSSLLGNERPQQQPSKQQQHEGLSEGRGMHHCIATLLPLLIPRYQQKWTLIALSKSQAETRPTRLTTTATGGDPGHDLFQGPEAGREIGTKETAGEGNVQYPQVPVIHPHPTHRLIQAAAAAAIASTERRNVITGARVEREIGSGTEITDERNRAKRATKVIGTAKRIRSGVNMIENIVERKSPSAIMVHRHPMMTTRMYVGPPFRGRK